MKKNNYLRSCFCLALSAAVLAGSAGISFAQDSNSPADRFKSTIIEQHRREALEKMSQKYTDDQKKKEEERKKEIESLNLDKTEEQEAGTQEQSSEEKRPAGEAAEDKAKNDEKIVFLKDINFSVSDVLPDSFFEDIKKKYQNTEVSVNDILNIVNQVNNEYLLKGYIASKAFLPEQDITEGELYISLVEGVINKISIEGNKHTSEKYLKRFITFENKDTLNVHTTHQDILEFNAANDAKARVTLEPGEVYGTSDLNLVVEEPNTFNLNLFIDNAGQEETGLYRYGLYGTIRSLTKFRDIFTIGGVKTDGSNSFFTSYEIPEPWLRSRVGAGFDYSDTEVVSGTLRPLDVTGDFYNVYIFLKKPVYVRDTLISNINFTAATKNGSSYITGFKTQETKTDSLSFSADSTMLFNNGYLFNMLTLMKGFKIFEGDNDFQKVLYHGEGYLHIIAGIGVNMRFKAQYSGGSSVPSSDQFQIGGINSVRGYTEGMMSANSGVSASAELQYILKAKCFNNKYINFLRPFAFFDYGYLFYDYDSRILLPEDLETELYSTGAGLRIGIYKYLEGSVTYARTLKEQSYYEYPEDKVLFSIHGRI